MLLEFYSISTFVELESLCNISRHSSGVAVAEVCAFM